MATNPTVLCLTFRYPYFLEVFIATISVMGTYGSAIYCVTPYESVSFRLIFLAAPVPMVIRGSYLGVFRCILLPSAQ
jgi:hypothetical protein